MQDLALSQRGLTPLQDLLRLLSGGLIAVVVTFCLYWLMASLVAAGREALTDAPDGKLVDFVRLKREQNLEVERPKPEKPDKPEAPPPDAPVPQTELDAPTGDTVAIGPMTVDASLTGEGFRLSASDGEYLPIVKVDPVYPSRALSRGIEGWVLLSFTVTENGSVEDPRVLDAKQNSIFDNAASRAVQGVKYKPRVENGKPIRVPNVQHLITFKIDDRKRGR